MSVMISLTGCATGGTNLVVGKEVTVSSCRYVWTVIDEEQKQLPLGDFENCDIFTSKTLRDIVDNNELLESERRVILR
jgi:hypothetical protein